MRILIVEDDLRLARGMAALLAAESFAVDVAHNAEDAAQFAATEPFNAIILDLGLPQGDGLDLLKTLRRRGDVTPIMIVTARDGLDDRVAGLDSGADDYMVKPFHPRELASRIRALVRRGVGSPDPVLRVGSLTLDRSSRRVELGQSQLDLRRREVAVLETLMGRPGKVVPKDRMAAEVFSLADPVAPNALEVYIGRLRRKLSPGGPIIHTVRGFGYMIDAC